MRTGVEREVEIEIHPGYRVTIRYFGDPEPWIALARRNHEYFCPECYEAACIERLKSAVAPTHIDEVVESGPAPAHWVPRMATPLVRLVPVDEGELARAKAAEAVSKAAFVGWGTAFTAGLRRAANEARNGKGDDRASVEAPAPQPLEDEKA